MDHLTENGFYYGYSLITEEEQNIKRAKGVQRYVVDKVITHDNYKQALEKMQPHYVKNRRIGSSNHRIYTYSNTKLALSATDDKRVLKGLNRVYQV